MKKAVSIFWFRRDLRLEDNLGLKAALASPYPVLPIFIFDPYILTKLEHTQDRRVDFIHRHVLRLHRTLSAVGSGLQVYHASVTEVFHTLLALYDVRQVYCNHDFDPYPMSRDKKIMDLMKNAGVSFHSYADHVIQHPDKVKKADGTPYTVYTPYSKKWRSSFHPATMQTTDTTNLLRDQSFCSLSLDAMGFESTDVEEGLPTLSSLESTVLSYAEHRNTPSIRGTTRLGIHLRFGTISIRKLAAWAAQKNQTFLNELIWRDFFQMIQYHFPHSTKQAFKPAYRQIPWMYDERTFAAWCSGHTGYPIVDAGMRELNSTGFMHNRVRMITASFLCKHMLHDWRLGERYFASRLLDYELASNVGNWQWAASTGCDAAPYFRVFNPELQQQKFDPDLAYVQQWIPEYGTPNYPEPIVVHKWARERALEHYKTHLNQQK